MKNTKDLLHSIEKNLLSDFNTKVKDVLSLCESPIEEKLLLCLINHFMTFEINGLEQYNPITFIEHWIFPFDSAYNNEDRKILLDKINKNKYRSKNNFFAKYIGFKTTPIYGESKFLQIKRPLIINERRYPEIIQEFEVYPQYSETIDETSFRVDIAIVLNRKSEGKIIETLKIALECDGYDFHSSPVQKMNDDIRTRKLKTKGWREIFRYSGKEINSLNTKEINLIFKEIEEMFYS